MKPMKNPIRHHMLRGLLCALAISGLSSNVAKANPYASSLTNNGTGIMSFYLNEPGGSVTITYEDGSTNASYNGITTGTNLPSGAQTFSVVGHTSYSISIFKAGPGVPTMITNTLSLANVRGVDVNKHPASPYFGRVYMDQSASVSAAGVWAFNSDLSTNSATVRSAGVAWAGDAFSPYRCSVADDDFIMVGIVDTNNSGVYRLDPTLTTNQLFLGPHAYGITAGVYGSIWSRPVLVGNLQNGPATLWHVDGDLPSPAAVNGYNSILGNTNITLATLPWQNVPDIQGPNLEFPTLPGQLLFNEYPGLQVTTNGLIYASIYRENFAVPIITIYTNDPVNGVTELFNSYKPGNSDDYFHTTNSAGGAHFGIIDIAVSPDGKYLAGVTLNNWFVICPLTNGLPDLANLFISTAPNTTANGRGIAFDAADNLYITSSGLGDMQSWTLGVTATAVTTGNTNGSTGFSLTLPSTTVSVVAITNFASQGGSDGVVGTPIPGVFTITRTNANGDYSAPITINFGLGGTATNGVYTVSPGGIAPATTTNVVVIAAGMVSTNITITPTTANVPRLQTTVILSLKGGSAYSVTQPASDIVYIQNTSTNQLVLTAGAPSMSKAFPNDFGSATITRLGDTNAAAYTVTSFTYSGSAVSGTDFVPVPAMTFNPGDLTHLAQVFPLSNGVPPVDTINPLYAGNKSVIVALPAGPALRRSAPTPRR
jgi:hypothetical protein